MNPKGLPSVDDKTAEPTTRRRMLALAGLAGAATAAAIARPASAAPTTPSTADADLLSAALGAELAAAELYQMAIDAGADDELLTVIQSNHQQYAERLGATIGQSPDTVDQGVVDEWQAAFESSDVSAVAAEAATFEQSLVATHLEQIEQLESSQGVELSSSILVVEARQAALLAALAGGDVEDMLATERNPLALTTPAGDA